MEKTKLKMLKIMDILRETDEEHPITAGQICGKLQAEGISAERKSVSSDIRLLMEYGIDIIMCADKKKGCYMASRQFEDWELKILIDAVWQAKCLTRNVSKTLVDKLLATTCKESRQTLKQATYIFSHAKTRNKTTQIAIDVFLRALIKGHKVSFQYTYIGPDLKSHLRKDGCLYTVSPYSLVWGNDFYYLICNTDGHEGLTWYRLDRMRNFVLTDIPSRPACETAGPDPNYAISEYVKNSIHHYGGKKIHLQLRTCESMIDHLLDQFGDNIIIKKEENKKSSSSKGEFCFLATVEASESDGLYYWLFQFGENIEIISPASVRAEYKRRLENILKKY